MFVECTGTFSSINQKSVEPFITYIYLLIKKVKYVVSNELYDLVKASTNTETSHQNSFRGG